MTPSHRQTLSRYADGDLPLNRAIRAALAEIDRLTEMNKQLIARRGSFSRLVRNTVRENAEQHGRGAKT